MSRVLVIGCGGVASVAIQKCCQAPEVFTELCIASRTKSKCDALAEKLAHMTTTKITTAQVDADKVEELVALINDYKPDLVMNIALPYQDLTIMDACLECGVNYMDTANYEPEDLNDPAWRAVYEKRCKEEGFSAYFDYSWQWAYAEKFEKAGLTALLGSGFDPGVTQAYCAYAKKHEFDPSTPLISWTATAATTAMLLPPTSTRRSICVRFRPRQLLGERPLGGDSRYEHQAGIPVRQVGQKDMYLLHHEEIESLAKNDPGCQRIRFFMTFGQSYLDPHALSGGCGHAVHRPRLSSTDRDRPHPIPARHCCPIRQPWDRAPRARPTSAVSSPERRTARTRPLYL